MKIKVESKLSGIYDKFEVLDKHGRTIREYNGFSNLITDIGMSRLSATGTVPVFNHCRVGSGSREPAFTDQDLQSQIAATSSATSSASVNLPEGYAQLTVVYTFGLGAAAGNISEIGTGWSDSGNSLFSRARIVNANGDPTTITILSDEILRVTWSHRRYWPTTDSTGVVENSGNKGGSYSWVCRASQVGSWTAGGLARANLPLSDVNNNSNTLGTLAYYTNSTGIGTITGTPDGTVNGTNAFTASNYSPVGSAASSGVRMSFNTAQGNFVNGLKCFKFGVYSIQSLIGYQVEFTPELIKTSNDLMTIDFEHSWGRR